MATQFSREEILRIIASNSSIADVSVLQDAVSTLVPGPAHIEHQQAKMRLFWPFLEGLVREHEPLLVELQQARSQLERPAKEASNEALLRFFTHLFVEAALWAQWIQHLDHVAAKSSQENKADTDRMALFGGAMRKRVVIIGGGPLSALLASVLAPFFRITLVTMERAVANQWRTRDMWLNSTCTIADPAGAPLPLKEGPTTRVIARPFQGLILGPDVDVLAQREALTIKCEIGSATYPWGPLFGDLIAHTLLMNVEEVVTHQWVDVSQFARNADGTLRLVMYDVDDGSKRFMDVFAVFLLTGPGPEVSKMPDKASNRAYQAAIKRLDEQLRQARTRIAQEREGVRQFNLRFSDPELQQLRKERSGILATTIARSLQRNLPHLLTLTAMQKVRAIWFELEALGASPDAYPLALLFEEENTVAYVGSQNTAQTLKECVDGNVSPRAYPKGVRPRGPRRSVIYNLAATTAQEYQEVTRRRYWDVFSPTTQAIRYKAARYRVVYDAKKEREVVDVTHFDAVGRRHRRRFDYLFDATGLDRSAIEEKLPSEFRMRTFYDPEGVAVARRDREGTLFIGGSATGTRAPAFSEEIQRILDALGISDNTVALWALGPALERLAYTFLLLQQVRAI